MRCVFFGVGGVQAVFSLFVLFDFFMINNLSKDI